MEDFLESQALNNNPWKWNSPPLVTEFHREPEELLGVTLGGTYSALKATTNGQTLRSTIVSHPRRSAASLDAQCKFNNAHFVTHLDTTSNISADMFLHKKVGNSSLSSVMVSVPNYNLRKLCLSSFKRYGSMAVSTDLKRSPMVGLQASLGTESLALGGKLLYLPNSTRRYRRLPLEFGILARNPSFTATTVLLVDKTLRSSCMHYLDKDKKLSAVLALWQDFRTMESSFMAGGEWVLDGRSSLSSTIFKATIEATIDDHRTLDAYVRHHVKDRNFWVEISGKFNTNALNMMPQICLSVESTAFT